MILTVAELRENVTTDLPDAALQVYLDWAEEAIAYRAGATGARTQLFDGGHRFISLDQPASSVTSITETWWNTNTVLAADDYLLRPDGYIIERLDTGTNPRFVFARRVAVVYVPVSGDATRAKVQIDLCNLAINRNPGVASETIGQWSQTYTGSAVGLDAEMEDILSQLRVDLGMVVIGDRIDSGTYVIVGDRW